MEDRLEIWLELIGGKLDRLIEIGESLEGQVRLPSELEAQTFADAKEPAKEPEPEHPPDPGEGYRILSKDPPEDLSPGDEYFGMWDGLWRESRDASEGIREQRETRWYRRKIEPAKSLAELIREPVEPILPKVGDWVRVTRPENWKECRFPYWPEKLNEYDGRVGQIEFDCGECFQIRGFVESDGFRYKFHRDWLSPAEPPKPPQPEYREPVLPDDASEMLQDAENAIKEARAKSAQYRQPVLPADAGKKCEFSDDGQRWLSGWVYGWVPGRNWVTLHNSSWKHARIKKDA